MTVTLTLIRYSAFSMFLLGAANCDSSIGLASFERGGERCDDL